MSYFLWGGIAFLVGFLVLRTFLPILREHRAKARRIKAAAGLPCQTCGASDARLYSFRTCRCFGIAPIAAVWETSTQEAVVCSPCARNLAVSACRRSAFVGGWGFPGVVVVAAYAVANMWELIRNRSARLGAVLRCVAWGIMVPWALLLLFFILLILVLALVLQIGDALRK